MERRWAVIVAVVLGLIAAMLVQVYLRGQKPPKVEETQVLVAAREIPKGAVIDYDMLAFQPMPPNLVIQEAALKSKEQAVGKTALVPIMPGEQILATKLAAPETGLTLAGKTPPGKRAFAISLETQQAAGGMIKPGDHVDVLAVFTSPPIIITLFQDVTVLAVGQEMLPAEERERRGEETVAPGGRGSITVALTPQEVQIISVAMEQGKIRLTLRPQMEVGRGMPAVDLSNLPPAVDFNTLLQFYIRRIEPTPSVEVIRGSKKEVTPLPSK